MLAIAENMPAPEWRPIDGLRIRYVMNEVENGRHILILSPWPESLFAFAATWNAFAALGKVVAVDLPGIGHSEGRPDLMAPEQMGEFLQHVLEAFQLRDVHVIAPDVGMHASLFAASNHPGMFTSAIIGSATIDHTKTGDGLNLLVNSPSIDAFKEYTGPQLVEIVAKTLVKYKIPSKIYEDFLQSYAGPRFLESVAFLRAFPKQLPVLRRRLPSIDMPCLIIAGRYDPFVLLPNAEILHKELPRNRLEIFDTGHSTWEDYAEDYARLATDWITGGYRTV